MKKKLCITLSLLMAFCIPTSSLAKVKVNGYFRKDGTYVTSHYRSNPDRVKYNNYSYPGNYNPNKNSYTPYRYKTPTYIPTTQYVPQYTSPIYQNFNYTKTQKIPTKWFYATNNTIPEYPERAMKLFDKYLKYKDNNKTDGVTNQKISSISSDVWKYLKDEDLIDTIDNNWIFVQTYADNGLTCVYRDNDKIEFSHRILFSLTDEQLCDDMLLLRDIIQKMYPSDYEDCLTILDQAISSLKDTDKQVHVFSPKGDAIISIYVRDYGWDTNFTVFAN